MAKPKRVMGLHKSGIWFQSLLVSVKNRVNPGDKMVDDLRVDTMQFIADERAKHKDLPCVLFLLILLEAERPGITNLA